MTHIDIYYSAYVSVTVRHVNTYMCESALMKSVTFISEENYSECLEHDCRNRRISDFVGTLTDKERRVFVLCLQLHDDTLVITVK